MDFEKLHAIYLVLINNRLDALLPLTNCPHITLFQAARYSLLSKAKRLRPLLTLSLLYDYNVPIHQGLDPACALEMVHTYSLIHDDLPSMDNDDYRRGKPSLHKAFSEATAILTGDFLLTYPFELLSKAEDLSESQRLRLILSLSSRSGSEGMIGGQIVDIESLPSDNETKLIFMHLHKTGDLFISALEFGGIIAGVNKEDFSLLQEIGKYFGLAFQMIDDLSDDTPSEKLTVISALGYEPALILTNKFLEQAMQALKKLSKPCYLLEFFIKTLSPHPLPLKK